MSALASGMVLAALCAMDPAARGFETAEAFHKAQSGYGDTAVELSMTLIAEDGRMRSRRLSWQTLENVDEGDRSLTVFDAPRDISGTVFLSIPHGNGEDEQWLFLPSLRRTKRISAANRTASFVGSELTYEDLLSDALHRYTYRWLREEPCALGSCNVIERFPRDPASGYSRQVVWLDRDAARIAQIDYYDRRGARVKTLAFAEYRHYEMRYWRAHRLTMTHHLSGRETELVFSEFAFHTGLTDDDFRPERIRRAR